LAQVEDLKLGERLFLKRYPFSKFSPRPDDRVAYAVTSLSKPLRDCTVVVWRLSRSSTAHWFRMVTVAEARKRHGGTWVWFIALWAIIGGVLQTIATMK